jgi:hypothetical protein
LPEDASSVTKPRPNISAVDALTTGLSETARRPWLAAIPLAIDLLIWLAPALSIRDLLNRLVAAWEALLPLAYTPDQIATMGDVVEGMRQTADVVGAEVNLWQILSGAWLSVPSALVAPQGTRLTFISDMIFAPVGLSLQLPRVASAPWQPAPVQIASIWLAALLGVLLWLAGMIFVTVLMRLTGDRVKPAQAPDEPARPADRFWRLFLRLSALSLVVGLALFVLRLPLSLVLTMIMLTGGATSAVLFAIIGGITMWIILWLLTSFYFASEAIVLDRQPVHRSIGQSLALVRMDSLAAVGLAFLINLLLVGFRAVWRLIGQNPAGAVFAMAGNAYLGTSMLLAIFTYYQDRRRKWEDLVAESRRRAGLNDRMKD